MPEVLQIIGTILLLVVGVGIILYVLFRKSPVKTAEPEEDTTDTTEENEDETDDIPEGDAPAKIESDGDPERND
ncbi:MAG: hypothetical protein J6Z13_05270 [Clostridia bacterium]|nr:hypothetical protein [Clostridia bacterium]